MLKERRAVDGFEGSSSWVGNGVGFVVAEMEEESEPMLGKNCLLWWVVSPGSSEVFAFYSFGFFWSVKEIEILEWYMNLYLVKEEIEFE